MLAGIATLGWALALAFAWVNASWRMQHQSELRETEARRKTPAAELDPQGPATGALPNSGAGVPPEPHPAPAAPGSAKPPVDMAVRPPFPGDAPRGPSKATASAEGMREPRAAPAPDGAASSSTEGRDQALASLQEELEATKERLARTERAHDEAMRALRAKDAKRDDAERRPLAGGASPGAGDGSSPALANAPKAREQDEARLEPRRENAPAQRREKALGTSRLRSGRITPPAKDGRRAAGQSGATKASAKPARVIASQPVVRLTKGKRRLARVERKAAMLDRRRFIESMGTPEAVLLEFERGPRWPPPWLREEWAGWMIVPADPFCPRP